MTRPQTIFQMSNLNFPDCNLLPLPLNVSPGTAKQSLAPSFLNGFQKRKAWKNLARYTALAFGDYEK